MTPIYQVDAFTAIPFAGNPAAVCVLSEPGDDGWMQRVAAEMNLSETAFLLPQSDGFDLRWFTPTIEVDSCGHATLASAHVLWETGRLSPEEVARFHTRSGLLTARKLDDRVELDFPATPVRPASAPADVAAAIGAPVTFVGKSAYDYLVEIDGEQVVGSLRPRLDLIRAWPARGVIVTSRATSPDVDFVSRFFGPASGIDEDPVTGSAHCALGPYWQPKLGKTQFLARQLSARGGEVGVIVDGDRVRLRGHAVTVLAGHLTS